MVFGEGRRFIVEHPDAPQGIQEFILRFMGKDRIGLKMKGDFPGVWNIETGKINGPLLFDEDSIYEVVTMDYNNRFIWLRQVFNSL
jgi:hypothetical protein